MNIGGIQLKPTDVFFQRLAVLLPAYCTCGVCGTRRAIDPAKCVAPGWTWPSCCGRTMILGPCRQTLADELRNKIGMRLWKEGI